MQEPVIKISLLDEQSIEQLMQIEAQVHITPWSKRKFQDYFSAGACQIFGAFLKAQLIGYAAIQTVEPEIELHNIAIDQRYQKQGLGRQFLINLLRHFQQRGASKIMLEVRASNQAAIRLYRGLGFSRVGVRQDYYKTDQGHEAAWLMSLVLY